VPKNVITAHLNWLPGDGQNAWVGTQWVDAQRYGGDFSNTCAALIPSHATLDARYARTLGSWEWSVAGSNLTDRHYFTNAYGCMTGIYPDDGRQMKVSLRYSF
jgi:iron complex outermembrane receptor protein